LISALFDWDGNAGCYFAYLPGERPVVGRENYSKLLPWQEHLNIMRAIAETTLPHIRYGVIIGFPDDDTESMLRLEEALIELYDELTSINPNLILQLNILSLSPIPGTPQSNYIRSQGLLHVDEPSLFGSIWMPSVDTFHLSYEEVADWQLRLMKIGSDSRQTEEYMNYGS